MSLFKNALGSFTLNAEDQFYVMYSYTNGADIGPSFAAPQSGFVRGVDVAPLQIQGFLKSFHSDGSVQYGALINNPNTFTVSFGCDVGDFQ